MLLPSALHFAHNLIREQVRAGDCVLDGTAGNGHDTCLLAELVGQSGRVWAFDIQKQALEATAARLAERGLGARVSLIHDGHQHLAAWVDRPLRLAVFNFGYLPGGDKSITTTGETSVAALSAAADRLDAGGLLLAVVYSGHGAGRAEAAVIEQWAQNLPQSVFQVLRYQFANQRNNPPYLLAVAKR
ncbi:class I SAM-dependent methyltransferase [Neisseria leonii]|uniref:Class I SAM-dependent methyltransferase n=1 Tax=Neisseria leonii TaxID=2995413 RepID=A0A9X4E4M2_9NEIS|nr:class I SAM-dependent methyltransferase [Neisseria sp. 51.81]MDD9327287.1 class I SAM-dependent methyltransferase [Neisseria sp. 51.81]